MLKNLLLVVSFALLLSCFTSNVNAQTARVKSNPFAELVAIAVSADGAQLAIARSSYDAIAKNGRVELWDLKTGDFRQTITGFDGSISYVSFAPDGQSLVTTSTEHRQTKIQSNPRDRSDEIVTELKWWDVRTGEFIRKTTLTGQLGRRTGPTPNESPTETFTRTFLTTPGTLRTVLSPDGTTIAVVKHYVESGINNHLEEGRAREESIRRSAGYSSVIETFDIELFDIKTGQRKLKMSGQAASISGWRVPFGPLAFSPDGKFFAVGAAREVKVWDATTGKKVQTIKKFDGNPNAISFSPDSKSLAISSGEFSFTGAYPNVEVKMSESQITIWEFSTAKLTRDLRVKNNLVASLKFAPSGMALLMGTLQYDAERNVGTVKVWDFGSNRLGTFNVHEGQLAGSLHILPGNEQLVLRSGADVEIRDVRTWRVTQSFEANSEDSAARSTNRFLLSVKQVDAVAFSSDGTTVSGVIPEEGLRVWDSRTGSAKPHQIKTSNGVIARSANGRTLAEVTGKEIKVWDLLSGTSHMLPRAASTSASTLALSSDGRLLAIAEESRIDLRSLDDEKFSPSLNGHDSAIQHLAFSIDQRTLVSADESGTIKIWDVRSGQLKQSISSGNIVTALAIDPAGQFVASAGSDYFVSVWIVTTGVLQLKLKKHDNLVNALAFSPDGKSLASGGDDRVAVVWDLLAGKSKQVLKGHDLTVTSLAFSPDGQLLATGSGNASVVLWNVNSGKLDRVLH